MRVGLDTVQGKIMASAVILAVAAAVAGLGTFGTFTASTSTASSTLASGTVSLALGASGTTNRLSVASGLLVPGDTAQRAVDLINTGNQNLASISLTTTATTSTLLDTSGASGLQIAVDRCPGGAWTEAGSSPAYTYTCAGGSTSVAAAVPVVQAALAMPSLAALTAGATDHLLITFSLPAGAGNTLQGLSSVIGLTWSGTQRAATNR